MRWVYEQGMQCHILLDEEGRDTGYVLDFHPGHDDYKTMLWYPDDEWDNLSKDELRQWLADPAVKIMMEAL